MKSYILITFLFLSFGMSAQNIVFSYAVDASVSNNVKVNIFARSAGANENMFSYTSIFYYNSAETAFVSYDLTPLDNLNWNYNGNFTATTKIGTVNEEKVSIAHDSKVEVYVLDGNNTGSEFSSTPIQVGTLIFDNTAGTISSSSSTVNEIFISNTEIDGAIVYLGTNSPNPPMSHDIVTEGAAAQSLPLELLSFDVRKKDKDKALLSWATANEVNTSHFEIERSTAGRNWVQVSEVEASHESIKRTDYTYVDERLAEINNRDGIFYYRIKMVDLVGAFTYTEVRSIKISANAISIDLYPNPATDGIWVSWDDNKFREVSITLIDITGKRTALYQFQEGMTGKEYIDLPEKLAQGTYLIEMATPYESIATKRLVVVD